MMDYYDGHWASGQWLSMGLLMLLLWGAVLAFTLWAWRSPRGSESTLTPQQLLEERYARGEIDTEEYQRRQEVLRGTPTVRS